MPRAETAPPLLLEGAEFAFRLQERTRRRREARGFAVSQTGVFPAASLCRLSALAGFATPPPSTPSSERAPEAALHRVQPPRQPNPRAEKQPPLRLEAALRECRHTDAHRGLSLFGCCLERAETARRRRLRFSAGETLRTVSTAAPRGRACWESVRGESQQTETAVEAFVPTQGAAAKKPPSVGAEALLPLQIAPSEQPSTLSPANKAFSNAGRRSSAAYSACRQGASEKKFSAGVSPPPLEATHCAMRWSSSRSANKKKSAALSSPPKKKGASSWRSSAAFVAASVSLHADSGCWKEFRDSPAPACWLLR